MSFDSSKKIINQFKALGQEEAPKLRKIDPESAKPFKNFLQSSKSNIISNKQIATNTPKSLPSLNKIAAEINNFKFDIDDEINNIY